MCHWRESAGLSGGGGPCDTGDVLEELLVTLKSYLLSRVSVSVFMDWAPSPQYAEFTWQLRIY